jgi:hypothetical protein
MSAKIEYYNDDEIWALHLVGDCPYDCPFCFDEEDYDEEIFEEEYRRDDQDYEPPLMDDEY